MSDFEQFDDQIIDPLCHPDSTEQAMELLRLTLPLLNKHHLPANPLFYSIAFAHHAGVDEGLSTDLKKLLEQGDGLSSAQAKTLFQRYLSRCDEALLQRYREDLLGIVAQTLGSLTDFAEKTSNCGQTLEQRAAQLASSGNIKDILRIVAEVIAETRALARETLLMETHLSTDTDEVQRLRAELSRAKAQATTDALTGLLNRRAFEQGLNDAVSTVDSGWPKLCLLVADLDYFKKINDNYGHILGDKVLRAVGGLLKLALKGRDQVARIGGEEFALLLPETELSGAKRVAEDIRARISKTRLKRVDTGQEISGVTVSIGVAMYRRGESGLDLFQRADQALYKAKRLGRDRIAIAE
jgi:diguanylate cyclase